MHDPILNYLAIYIYIYIYIYIHTTLNYIKQTFKNFNLHFQSLIFILVHVESSIELIVICKREIQGCSK